MFIQLDVGVDVSKRYFLKTFLLSFAASSWGETPLFCDCAKTHFLIMSLLFCRIPLSLSPYVFLGDVILLQSSWSMGDLKK